MINVSKIVEHILSNVCKVSSAGLYNGKAGISLALFEASKILRDECIENEAFSLLKEALILKGKDLSFENGLSGIGYALCYLIENKFIKADFDEIFGEQYEKIIKSHENIEKEPERLLNSLKIIYFLTAVKKKDERLQKIIKKIFEGLELFLIVQFQDFADVHYIKDKIAVLRIFEIYLKLVNYADYKHFSHSALSSYAELYRHGNVLSSTTIGYYLDKLAKKNVITEYYGLVNEHIMYGVRNIRIDELSLRKKIDLLKCFYDAEKQEFIHCDLMRVKEKIAQNIFKKATIASTPLGYKDGLARLLLFCVNKKAELL